MNKIVFIVGATSRIAQCLAAIYAKLGWTLILAGRNSKELRLISDDLQIRYDTRVIVKVFDALTPQTSCTLIDEILGSGLHPDIVFFFMGSTISESEQDDIDSASKIIAVNYLSIVTLVNKLLPSLKQRPGNCVAFIGSVAGDRGRKTNFLYGAAKAALHTYAQGLRAMLYSSGVHVITVKLGYVDTRLSYGKAVRFLTVSPAYAARKILSSVERRKNVIYIPAFWRPLMLLIRSIPEWIFKRLPFP